MRWLTGILVVGLGLALGIALSVERGNKDEGYGHGVEIA